MRLPAIYVSHGGGPWPFVEVPFIPKGALEPLRAYLASLVTSLPAHPRAILIVSAHWEAPVATIMTNPQPPMLYDYTGFAPEAYQLQWPAPSALFLVGRVKELLAGAGFHTAEDPERGFDHGSIFFHCTSWQVLHWMTPRRSRSGWRRSACMSAAFSLDDCAAADSTPLSNRRLLLQLASHCSRFRHQHSPYSSMPALENAGTV